MISANAISDGRVEQEKPHLTLPGGVGGACTSSMPASASGRAGRKSSSKGLIPSPRGASEGPAPAEGGSEGGLVGSPNPSFAGVSAGASAAVCMPLPLLGTSEPACPNGELSRHGQNRLSPTCTDCILLTAAEERGRRGGGGGGICRCPHSGRAHTHLPGQGEPCQSFQAAD